MKRNPFRLCCLLFLSICLLHGPFFAADPEDLNCDFEGGMDRWRGDGRLETDESSNRVCTLKKTGNRKQEITHKLDIPESVQLEIHYRARAMPGSEGVIIRRAARSAKGAGFSHSELKADGKWVNQKFSVNGEEGERSTARVIALIFHEGTGVVQIDDIKVVPRNP